MKICSNLFYNELFENIIRDEAVNEIEIEKVVMHFKIINYVIYIFYLLQILERNTCNIYSPFQITLALKVRHNLSSIVFYCFPISAM